MALLGNTLKFDHNRSALQRFLFDVASNFPSKQHEANHRYVSNSHAPNIDDASDEVADTGAGPLERLLVNEAAESVRVALPQISPHYWDVTCTFRGQEYRMQMSTPPGSTVNAQGVLRV